MMMMPIAIMAIADDDDRAFMEQLYTEHASLMTACAMKVLRNPEDASDAVEQVLVKLIENIRRIREVPCNKLRAYIVTTIKNTSIDIAIKRNRENKYAFTAADDLISSVAAKECPVDEQILLTLQTEALIKAIGELSANERAIIEMKYLTGLHDQEIAQTLSLSPSTVRVYVSRARRNLYRLMKGQGYEE